jgi:serine phosphatase RsbU (regulator of sigma subunit)
MKAVVLSLLGLICLAAAFAWARSARLRLRHLRGIERQEADAYTLAWSSTRRELHAASLYLLLAIASFWTAAADTDDAAASFALITIPALMSIGWARGSLREARLARSRLDIERRAEEALAQQELAPRAWAARLAPDELPGFSGFEVGKVYQAGSGFMAGDFFDVLRVGPTRLAALIGDVSGHGIESSITAFQAKYLLRVFLRQFRDPAQALEELNRQMSAMGRAEEFISLIVLVFDTEASTLRYASAGHPAGFVWHEREVQPLRATGPLVMLDPDAQYFSREIQLDRHDLVLLYTDGLAEARDGDRHFGEDRIANAIRRDPGIAPDVLCKALLDAANDFSGGVIDDDVAILAIRRS